jgi:hypothetical protein
MIENKCFLPFKGRIKVRMGIKKPRYKPILTPTLSLKERVVGYRPQIGKKLISLHYLCGSL